MAKQSAPIGFRPQGSEAGPAGSSDAALSAAPTRPLVPIHHVGAIERAALLERYDIRIVGVPDEAHNQLVQVVRDLEIALTAAGARIARAVARYSDLAES